GSDVWLALTGGRVLRQLARRWYVEADGLTNLDLGCLAVAADGVYAGGLAGRVLRRDGLGTGGAWTLEQPASGQAPLTRAEVRGFMVLGVGVYAVAADGAVLGRGMA